MGRAKGRSSWAVCGNYDNHGMPRGRVISTTSETRSTSTSWGVSKTGSLMPGSDSVNDDTSNVFAPDHVAALANTCRAYSRYLKGGNHVPSSPAPIERKGHINYPEHDQFHFVQTGNTAKLMMEVLSIHDMNDPDRTFDTKTFGFVRLKNQLPRSMAFSGWMQTCGQRNETLLDGEFWTDAVLEFSRRTGFQLPRHCFDGKKNDGERRYGRASACHVEKKLMLQCICELVYDKNLGGLSPEKLETVRGAKLEAEVILDLAPCKPCKSFGRLLEDITGVRFSIHTQTNLLQRLMPTGKTRTTRDAKISSSSYSAKIKQSVPRALYDRSTKCATSSSRDSHLIPSPRSMQITKLQQQQAKVRGSSFRMESISQRCSVSGFETKASRAQAEKSYWKKFAEDEFMKFIAPAPKSAASKSERTKFAKQEFLTFATERSEVTAAENTDFRQLVEQEFLKFAGNLKRNAMKGPPR
ncbi:hypothetical protein ACMFMG_002137 [Clarireedia jacksonii]